MPAEDGEFVLYEAVDKQTQELRAQIVQLEHKLGLANEQHDRKEFIELQELRKAEQERILELEEKIKDLESTRDARITRIVGMAQQRKVLNIEIEKLHHQNSRLLKEYTERCAKTIRVESVVAHLVTQVKAARYEMQVFLSVISWLENDPALWIEAIKGTGIATANSYRAVLERLKKMEAPNESS
jgi:chromosome segregation ATPase